MDKISNMNKINDSKTRFLAVVEFNDDNHNETIDVMINKGIEHLTYDEVENAIWDIVDTKHGYVYTNDDNADEDFPYKIVDIVVEDDSDGKYYPVVPDDKDKISKIDASLYEKYLVLPYATYSLTPECKLWLKLKEAGILDSNAEFDFDEMHKLIEVTK